MFVPLISVKDEQYLKRRQYVEDQVANGVDIEVRPGAVYCGLFHTI